MKYCITTFLVAFVFLVSYTSAQIQLFNDEFDDDRSLINWKNINLVEQWGIEQLESRSINDGVNGKLQMIPRTASWFGGYRGPLLYKEVSGNFIITTKVDAIGRDNILPVDDFNLAGLMIRHVRNYPDGALDPTTGWTAMDNNYIFLSIGSAKNNSGFCQPNPGNCMAPNFEVKSTIDGNSVLSIQEVDTTSAMIRVARIGGVFIVLYRLETDHIWVVHRRYDRGDFPDTVQVGFVTYTDWTKVSSYNPAIHNRTQIEGEECNMGPPCHPDIIGEFEYARFDSLVIPQGIGMDFLDEVDVTDEELLSFLDYPSIAFCPDMLRATMPIDSNTYQRYTADLHINLENTIGDNSLIITTAMDSVVIDEGFNIGNNSILEITLNGCM